MTLDGGSVLAEVLLRYEWPTSVGPGELETSLVQRIAL